MDSNVINLIESHILWCRTHVNYDPIRGVVPYA